MGYDLRKVQAALNAKGFGPVAVDGVFGPKTSKAVRAFKRSVGLADRDYIGPVTYARMTGDTTALTGHIAPSITVTPSWYLEMAAMLGKHEVRDHDELALWLKSDGATVGDPAKVPWCADAVATAIRRVLPNDPLPSNPYLAANWVHFGKEVSPQRGCILSFWRGSRSSSKGHVGFYAGENDDNFYVLGGNQNNMICIAPISKKRLRKGGSRWPLTGIVPTGCRVIMSGGIVSTNEA